VARAGEEQAPLGPQACSLTSLCQHARPVAAGALDRTTHAARPPDAALLRHAAWERAPSDANRTHAACARNCRRRRRGKRGRRAERDPHGERRGEDAVATGAAAGLCGRGRGACVCEQARDGRGARGADQGARLFLSQRLLWWGWKHSGQAPRLHPGAGASVPHDL
jgi:hypothetical protein